MSRMSGFDSGRYLRLAVLGSGSEREVAQILVSSQRSKECFPTSTLRQETGGQSAGRHLRCWANWNQVIEPNSVMKRSVCYETQTRLRRICVGRKDTVLD